MSVGTLITLNEEGILHLSKRLGEPEWMRDQRLAAFKAYENLPVPSWDRTSLTGMNLESPAIAVESSGEEVDLPATFSKVMSEADESATYVIEVDQVTRHIKLAPELEKDGVIVADLSTAIKEHEDLLKEYFQSVVAFDEDKLVALHYAAVSSGLFVYVPKNVRVARPIEYRVYGSLPGVGLYPHILIVAEQGSEVTVIEGVSSHDQDKQRIVSEVVEIIPKDGAQVRFGSVQTWGDQTWQSTIRRSDVSRDARVEWMSGDFGSRLSRTHSKSVLAGEGSESTNHSVFFGNRSQHLDVGITMMHVGEHTASDMLTKGVLKDRARVVYRGLTDIENGARFASGFQNENTMLLSKNARSDAIPGLEIDETEVQAGHAATTGQMDPVHLFYLMSRGLSEEDAIHLIVTGFFDPVVSAMSDEGMQEEIKTLIDGKMLA